jgi:hypothetical protein
MNLFNISEQSPTSKKEGIEVTLVSGNKDHLIVRINGKQTVCKWHETHLFQTDGKWFGLHYTNNFTELRDKEAHFVLAVERANLKE